jgi:hypothetical protein
MHARLGERSAARDIVKRISDIGPRRPGGKKAAKRDRTPERDEQRLASDEDCEILTRPVLDDGACST